MKPRSARSVKVLVFFLAVTSLGTVTLSLKDAVVVEWYIFRLNRASVNDETRWSTARTLESLGDKGLKTAEGWYLGKLKSGDDSERRRAASRLGEMRSEKAAPLLLERLRIDSAQFSFEQVPFFSPPPPLDTDLLVFPVVGPCGRNYWSCRYRPHYAAVALERIGEPAVPALLEALGSEERAVRFPAAYIFSRMESVSPELLGEMMEKVKAAEWHKSMPEPFGWFQPTASCVFRAALRFSDEFGGDDAREFWRVPPREKSGGSVSLGTDRKLPENRSE